MVLHPQFCYTNVFSPRWALKLIWLAFQQLLSLRFKLTLWLSQCVFWISSLQILDLHRCTHSDIIVLWIEFSPLVIACRALRWRCSRRSHPSEQNFLRVWREWLLILFRRLFFDIDCATLITKPPLFSLSLSLPPSLSPSLSLSSNRFPDACFLCFYLKSKIIMRNVRNRGFKHCENTEQSNVLVCVFFEKSEISLRSGSSMSIVSLSTEVILSNSLGSSSALVRNLCWGRTWPDSQSSRPPAEMRMPWASRTE